MSSVLPIVALLSVDKNRRRRLLPLALPAVTGMPVAQAGALAVVSADSVARREGNVATAEAATAVTAVLSTAVEKGAVLAATDLQHIPLAQQVVAANPAILTPVSVAGASREDLERALAVIQAAMAEGGGEGGGAQPDDEPELTLPKPPKRGVKS